MNLIKKYKDSNCSCSDSIDSGNYQISGVQIISKMMQKSGLNLIKTSNIITPEQVRQLSGKNLIINLDKRYPVHVNDIQGEIQKYSS